MEIVTAYLAGIVTAGVLWFLVRWFEVARDPELEAVYRQRAEEERVRQPHRQGVFWAEESSLRHHVAADLDRRCTSIGRPRTALRARACA
ncbi:hypothetical protein LGM89_17920 [Burkholderia sp. AU31624]|uniref:hypothetical protein n=1 Tax=Burkholderia sp. AU31624 TaxID=2879629 RepID=UPI001CF47C13|nr:hypothetical protein [Burkholderia sp. AU31624]MCA8255153.1 hypothetical protein [Burkholderia sp. AU31624]